MAMQINNQLEDYFEGTFIPNAAALRQKYRNIKAFIFDWDGVFNEGRKNIDGHSSFSEVDSMGINLMRFGHFQLNKQLPITAIITGENNQLAFSFAKRENFHAIYSKVSNKEKAMQHFCKQHNISPSEVMFVFDDVLDFSVANIAGVRMMVSRTANPMLNEFAKKSRLVDYITKHDGNNYALREISELVMTMTNNFTPAVEHRMRFTEQYQNYINVRRSTPTLSYILDQNEIIPSENIL
jgi:3-deoxy-D-manno-octulosonate 8-phosphate phosphatase (KDO 8-P phosphatase)